MSKRAVAFGIIFIGEASIATAIQKKILVCLDLTCGCYSASLSGSAYGCYSAGFSGSVCQPYKVWNSGQVGRNTHPWFKTELNKKYVNIPGHGYQTILCHLSLLQSWMLFTLAEGKCFLQSQGLSTGAVTCLRPLEGFNITWRQIERQHVSNGFSLHIDKNKSSQLTQLYC